MSVRDVGSRRCGHNYDIPQCPYPECAARAMYETLRMLIEANRRARNADDFTAEIAFVCEHAKAAIAAVAQPKPKEDAQSPVRDAQVFEDHEQ